MRQAKDRHITRFTKDQHGWDGYWVRLLDRRTTPSKYASNTFPSKKYGGIRKALVAARLWRDSTMKLLGYSEKGTLVEPGKSHLASRARTIKRGSQPDLPVGVSETIRVRKNGGRYCTFNARIAPSPMTYLAKAFVYDESLPGSREKVLKMAAKQRATWEKQYYKTKKSRSIA
jgi:hypothetical protein